MIITTIRSSEINIAMSNKVRQCSLIDVKISWCASSSSGPSEINMLILYVECVIYLRWVETSKITYFILKINMTV